MQFFEPLLRDRRDAGRQLAAALAHYRQDRPIVLALPRGGVPVGFEVAKALAAPLDVLLVRKIGAPGHEGLALGAIVDGQDPQLVLNDDVVRSVAPRPGYNPGREGAAAGRDRTAAAELPPRPAAAPGEWARPRPTSLPGR